MAYAGRNNIYDGVIRKMVTQALETRETEFRTEHQHDTSEQLAAYLQSQAMQLGHVPWPREIQGGTVIEERFGSWEKALTAAGLSWPETENKPSAFPRVMQIEQEQKEIYRQRKNEKKLQSEARKRQQAARKKEREKK